MKKVSGLFVLLLLFTACKKDLSNGDAADSFKNLRVDANVVAAKEKLVGFIRSTDFVNRMNNYDKRSATTSNQTNSRAAGLPHTTDMEDYASFI